MKVVILQPGFIPWLGFFSMLHLADRFVIYDDVQYTIGDRRNRKNRIRTNTGTLFLTVIFKGWNKKRKKKYLLG